MTAPANAIRPATLEDLPAITDIYNAAIRTTTSTFDTEEQSIETRRQWFLLHGEPHPILVSEEAGEVVGWAAVSSWSGRCAYSGTVESSIYIADRAHGRGHGTRLLKALIEETKRVGHHTVLARIADGNPVSIRLHEKFGFEEVGVMREVGRKFDRWLDVTVMQLMLED